MNQPEVFITKVANVVNTIHKVERDGRLSYWLEVKDYERFKDNWNAIGSGFGAIKIS